MDILLLIFLVTWSGGPTLPVLMSSPSGIQAVEQHSVRP